MRLQYAKQMFTFRRTRRWRHIHTKKHWGETIIRSDTADFHLCCCVCGVVRSECDFVCGISANAKTHNKASSAERNGVLLPTEKVSRRRRRFRCTCYFWRSTIVCVIAIIRWTYVAVVFALGWQHGGTQTTSKCNRTICSTACPKAWRHPHKPKKTRTESLPKKTQHD